jgi:hypothetical protein
MLEEGKLSTVVGSERGEPTGPDLTGEVAL